MSENNNNSKEKQKKGLLETKSLKHFDLSKTSKAKHFEAIDKYLREMQDNPEFFRKHKAINQRNIGRDILEKYFIHNWSLVKIASAYKLSRNTVTKYLHDYLLRHYDDTLVEEISVMDSEGHLGILNSFFASVFFLAREAAFNAIFLRKVREEVAKHLAKHGVVETVRNKDLMKAWETSSVRLERYTKLTNEQLKTYLDLMEKVLDRQRDIAIVRILYDYLNKLDENTALKLKEALERDEYAKAVFESLPAEALVSVFRNRLNEGTFVKDLELRGEELEKEVIDDVESEIIDVELAAEKSEEDN